LSEQLLRNHLDYIEQHGIYTVNSLRICNHQYTF